MRPRQRFLAALRRQPIDRPPLWDIEFHAWHAFAHGAPVLGTAFAALSEGERRSTVRCNAAIIAEVAADLGMDAVTAPANWWEDAPGHPAWYILPDGWEFQQAEALVEAAQGRFAVVGNAGGVLGASYDVDFCVRLVEDPASIEAEAEAALQHGLARAARFAAAGCEAVVTASDIADNHGPFFRPRHFQRFILPYLRRWSDGVHALGLAGIMHSDGDLRPQLGELAGSGIDALQAIDPTAGMDLPSALAQVAGRICLCGNLPCSLLLHGPCERIAAETGKLLASCHGSFILGCSNAVLPETPAAHYRAVASALATWETAHAA